MFDLVYWHSQNEGICPHCGVDFNRQPPEYNLLPHYNGACISLPRTVKAVRKDYWSWAWLAKWFFPLPLLLWYSRKVHGWQHVWWQGKDCQLELHPRFTEEG